MGMENWFLWKYKIGSYGNGKLVFMGIKIGSYVNGKLVFMGI